MKTVVVTGASQGLGLQIAGVFAQAGWRVVGTGRLARPDGLDVAVEYRQFDAANAEACAGLWRQLELVEGEAVCLVNNAGGYVHGGLLEAQPADYEQQLQSNFLAGAYMTRGLAQVAPRARIINIVSANALAPSAGNAVYGAVKAAALHFYQSLQKEFAAEQYRITNVCPALIDSHGDSPEGIAAADLANFVREQAESNASYYLKDVTLYPVTAAKE